MVMKKTKRLLGALVAVCASVSVANLAAAAQCQGTIITINNVLSQCNEPNRVGNASFNNVAHTATVNLVTGASAVARQRDASGNRVFCGAGQVAPVDTIQGNGKSAGADQSACITNNQIAVSVQVLVTG